MKHYNLIEFHLYNMQDIALSFFENLFPISDKADQKHLQQLIFLDQKEIIIRSANETSLRVELYNKHFKS